MPESVTRKVISLIRVSSLDQAKGDRTGIPRQLEDIEIHCRHHKLKVVKEYRLEGLSGANVQRSRRFKEMLAQLSDPSIAGVVFATLDRFFRPENLSTYQVFQPFESTGKHLFCELGELDSKNSQDQMKIVIWGQQAGFERERMKDRMVRGKNRNRHEPQIKSDTLPVGVAYDRATRLFSYTADAERVEKAFGLVMHGDTLASIVHDLGWTSVTALRATLKSYWWIGVKASVNRRVDKRWDEVQDRMSEGRRVPRELPIMVDTNLASTPLVKRETFFAVQDILKQNRTSWTQRKSCMNEFLCSGLLYCECGRKMYHKTDNRPGKPNYYLCSTNYNKQRSCGHRMIDAKETDREVWIRIKLYTKSEQYIIEQLEIALNEQHRDESVQTAKDAERKVAEINKRIDSIVKNIEYSTEFSPALAERRKTLESELIEAKANLSIAKSHVADRQAIDVKEVAKQIRKRFWKKGELSLIQKKALLVEMVERIGVTTELDEVSVDIRFRVPNAIMATRTYKGSWRPRA
jgi:DNA invertase Pin-like site-specific DNA recombinase